MASYIYYGITAFVYALTWTINYGKKNADSLLDLGGKWAVVMQSVVFMDKDSRLSYMEFLQLNAEV